ncbi:MAG: non-heme iron oxygenase ferredoxin subunit [Actinomycetota bacterium]|nr:non-heme iron oxygenase ferredoxin subunit [Actinomycetota bacterium]MEC9316488.1 non-heme iron oxygenase ferredoxin subunit [Actinomycetota bacterium]MED5551090.1 non-heme iron oxygenase ferredoxin subunit [Actinomycetota bacterium]MEE3140385.1 non-heme iron oxygenase ferredoxin subunit [Actinomycetota bacterium]|tara:strand:+ start:963 stop:1271 length:309 start_codon:yes stop_codon:yes gene_type:complete
MTIVCHSDDLTHGEAQRFDIEGHRIAVVRIGDNVHAVADRCSHANYSLSEGVVWPEECAIECPKHFSKFNLRTGTPDVFPATQPITVYEARVLDGEVIVDLP